MATAGLVFACLTAFSLIDAGAPAATLDGTAPSSEPVSIGEPSPMAAGAVPGARSPGRISTQDTELAERHREWLQIVTYIISDRERRLFAQLETDWQRDQFIDAFWKSRDPIPVTPENEFQQEHMRRWIYANDVLARDTPVPGWRTDRGRVYILQGEPFRIHRYPNTQELWPLEIWEYRDQPRAGLPAFFQIVFFKPRDFNEWRLYSPAVDGIRGLVRATPADDIWVNPDQLWTKFPMVFDAARQVAPGYGTLGSEMVLARIMAPPEPEQPLASFWNPEGVVSATFVAGDALRFEARASPGRHAELEGYVDLAVELPADELLFTEVEGEFLVNLDVTLEIEETETKLSQEQRGTVLVRLAADEYRGAQGLPLLYRQRIWLLAGRYRLRVIARDTASRRVGVAEVEATVPPSGSSTYGPPIFFYLAEAGEEGSLAPFSLAERAVVPWVRTGVRRGRLGTVFKAYLGETATPPPFVADDVALRYRLLRDDRVVTDQQWGGSLTQLPEEAAWAILQDLDLTGVEPGSYRLDVVSGGTQDESDGTLVSTPLEVVDGFVPVGRLLSRAEGDDDLGMAHDQIGQQLLRRNQPLLAQEHFRAAVRADPANPRYRVNAAKTLIWSGDLSVAANLVREALAQDETLQEGWVTLGLLHLQQGDPTSALDAYRRSLDTGPPTAPIYNGIAEAYLNLGRNDEAIEALERSLQVNPDQEQVRQLLARLRGRHALEG